MTLTFSTGESVTLPEIPFRPTFELPAAETAIVIVDMQNDFVDPKGALPVPTAAATVPAIRRLYNGNLLRFGTTSGCGPGKGPGQSSHQAPDHIIRRFRNIEAVIRRAEPR
jgi:nicotinamidase-related amidase